MILLAALILCSVLVLITLNYDAIQKRFFVEKRKYVLCYFHTRHLKQRQIALIDAKRCERCNK